MGMITKAGREKISLKNLFRTIKYKINFRMENPEYFDADGLFIFVGSQGTGKTLSAVNYTCKLLEMYPNSKLVTNLLLSDYPIVTFDNYLINNYKQYGDEISNVDKDKVYDDYLKYNRVFPFNNNDDFKLYNNGQNGVIFFVDEIQLYLNSLESKNVNIETVAQISQQRKQRKHIVATSQVFGRMAKPLREQFSNVVKCKCFAGVMQNNALIDRDSIDDDDSTGTNISGKVKHRFVWFHSPEMYKRYDTYYVIEKGKFVGGEAQKGGLYNNDLRLSIDNK
ncbi:MAG: ATP-binding protein [Nitrososphaeria archaeon]